MEIENILIRKSIMDAYWSIPEDAEKPRDVFYLIMFS